jgi:hypothetical protein
MAICPLICPTRQICDAGLIDDPSEGPARCPDHRQPRPAASARWHRDRKNRISVKPEHTHNVIGALRYEFMC